LPEGSDNIVVKAIARLRELAGVRHGASVRLTKRIPSAAGLGGASSDAAAALVAVNRLWRLHWPLEQLRRVAGELGSDIPFFLGCDAAVCRGRGERISPFRLSGSWWFVVARPPVGLSTPQVYRACRPAPHPCRLEPLAQALARGDAAAAGKRLTNRLEAAAEKQTEWIDRLRRAFAATDCYGHQMSGSGSSYFGICRSARHARRVAAWLRSQQLGAVFVAANATSWRTGNNLRSDRDGNHRGAHQAHGGFR
jgi:4-diphosphocytidyl-2-C-methyl-D-erythritol kinase